MRAVLRAIQRRIVAKLTLTLVGFVAVTSLVMGLYLDRALDRFAAEKIFELDFAQLSDHDFALKQVLQTRDDFELAMAVLADLDDATHARPAHRRQGNHELVDPVIRGYPGKLLNPAQHRYTMHFDPLLGRVVIHATHGSVTMLRQFADEHLRRGSCPDHEHAPGWIIPTSEPAKPLRALHESPG